MVSFSLRFWIVYIFSLTSFILYLFFWSGFSASNNGRIGRDGSAKPCASLLRFLNKTGSSHYPDPNLRCDPPGPIVLEGTARPQPSVALGGSLVDRSHLLLSGVILDELWRVEIRGSDTDTRLFRILAGDRFTLLFCCEARHRCWRVETEGGWGRKAAEV